MSPRPPSADSNLPTGDVTFLLTDIEGSTKRWESFPAVMRSAVERHDRILVRLVELHGGVDLRKKGEGDSHFAVFRSADQAVACAVAIHAAMASEDWGQIAHLSVRVAVHTGPAALREGDYYGPVVNRCARLRSVGHGGQTLISSATKRLLGNDAAHSLSFRDLGIHRLKDLLEPERIFQVSSQGGLEDFAPLTSLSAAKHNLPLQLTSFVGREKQVADAKRLLSDRRLVSFLGAGGSGKTRLALQVAAEVLDEFADGVWFVPLAELQDTGLVAQRVAESLPISIQGQDPMTAVADSYVGARALFVLDNCEHLGREPAEVVNQILHSCPHIVILATSRQALGVSGENVYQVPPLDCELRGGARAVHDIAKLEAVDLLCQRAMSRGSSSTILTSETAEDIAKICKKLDGIPLALEQAAANFAYKTPAEVLQLLETHFKMLAIDEVGIEDRHRTIEATIDWSYSRLDERQQRIFETLTVFVGGCTAEAAAYVCKDHLFSDGEVATTLDDLVKKSMIVSERPEGLRSSRYRMLEPIRQYGMKRRAMSEEEPIRERHFHWMYSICQQAYEAGLDAADGRFRKIVTLEHDNCRAALQWSMSQRGLGDRPLEMSIFLYRFWLTNGHVREGLSWLQQTLNNSSDVREELRAQALLYLGVLSWQQGSLDAAVQALEESFRAYDALGDLSGTAKAKANLGNVAFARSDIQVARDRYQDATLIFQSTGDEDLLATTLENLGVAESLLSHFSAACQSLTAAIRLRRKLGKPADIAKALDSLLGVYRMQGLLANHLDLFDEAVTLALESDDGFAMENLLEVGAQISIDMGETMLAAQALGALDRATDENRRIVPPNLKEYREQLRLKVLESTNQKTLRKGIREGYSLGSAEVLQFIVDCVMERPGT